MVTEEGGAMVTAEEEGVEGFDEQPLAQLSELLRADLCLRVAAAAAAAAATAPVAEAERFSHRSLFCRLRELRNGRRVLCRRLRHRIRSRT